MTRAISRRGALALLVILLTTAALMTIQMTTAEAQTPKPPRDTDASEGTPVPPAGADPTATPEPQPQQSATPAAPTQPPPSPTPTPVPPKLDTIVGAFRVPPTSSIRPVNDIISYNQDGLIEVMLRNPVLNDIPMEVELTVSVPSGFHLYGEGLVSDLSAGTASAHYVIHPGHARTIYLNVKAAKVGSSTLHFSANFWPAGNKDLFNPISLTHPFTVTEASADPLTAPNTDKSSADAEPAGPAASCAVGSVANGDLALLSIGLMGITGMMLVRRRRN